MKRLTLHVLASILTFFGGIGVDQLISRVRNAAPPPQTNQVQPPFVTVVPEPVLPNPISIESPKPVQASTKNLILDYDEEKFDPSGTYTIFGRTPKEFPGFEGIEVSVYQTNGTPSGEIIIYPISSETAETYPVSFALVSERRLYFGNTSQTETGVQYRFDGEFLPAMTIPEVPEGTVVLKGTLTKLKNGKKIAERSVKFQIQYDHC